MEVSPLPPHPTPHHRPHTSPPTTRRSWITIGTEDLHPSRLRSPKKPGLSPAFNFSHLREKKKKRVPTPDLAPQGPPLYLGLKSSALAAQNPLQCAHYSVAEPPSTGGLTERDFFALDPSTTFLSSAPPGSSALCRCPRTIPQSQGSSFAPKAN